jgi:hypothetical protein
LFTQINPSTPPSSAFSFQRDIQPLVYAFHVFPGTALDDQINANRPVGEAAYVSQSRSKIMAVHVTQAQRLYNADTASL